MQYTEIIGKIRRLSDDIGTQLNSSEKLYIEDFSPRIEEILSIIPSNSVEYGGVMILLDGLSGLFSRQPISKTDTFSETFEPMPTTT